ncbi:MAG: hypothetical protein KGN98_10395 [Alphaproteobacteria bacterium]|jgi:hypothetical protein|nr:hypothetical protein [Alphaproteobacteria bacterium]
MSSLEHRDPSMIAHMGRSADGYSADAADSMKNMVMGMIAVALVLASVMGTILLSGAVHQVSGVLCASLDLPSLVRLS